MNKHHEYDIDKLSKSSSITKRQLLLLETLKEVGTVTKAAKKLGVKTHTITEALNRAEKKYIRSKLEEQVALGQQVKGTSTLYRVNEDTGKKEEVLQWVKTKESDEELQESMRLYVDSLVQRTEGLYLPKSYTKTTESDLVVAYVNTDLHLGQYSWDRESGENVNAEIVYSNTIKANSLLLDTTPQAGQALLIDLGDTLHASNDSNRTKSGHELDVDTRHARIFEMLVDMKIKMVNAMLGKHNEVRYVIIPGNHSDLVSHYMIAMLKAYYRDEPRFTVDDSVSLHKYYRFGEVLLGFHHGHATPMNRLPEVMVWDRKEAISNTTYRYWLTGHVHKDRVVDSPIARCESFRNNTNNDAWAAGSGYRGLKQTVAVTYHKSYGEVARNIVPIKMLG